MHDGARERDQALEWAAAARGARARLREALSSAATTLPEVLSDARVDPMVGSVRLLFVLESLPGARKTDTRRVLAELGLDGDRPIGGFDDDERALLLASFDPARPVP